MRGSPIVGKPVGTCSRCNETAVLCWQVPMSTKNPTEFLCLSCMLADEKRTRPTWDEYFLGIARAVAARADCTRAKHGAVIVKDHRIVATGYNAAPSGGPSCLAGECPRGLLTTAQKPSLSGYDDCVSLHAEANALLYADRSRIEGGTIYITGQPCSWCERLISGSGIVRVVFPQ